MSDDADKKKPKKPAKPAKKAAKKAAKKTSKKKAAPKKVPKKTAKKKTPAKKKPAAPKRTKEDKLLDAIKTHFSGVRGKLSAKFLFESADRKRFRCNWYDIDSGALEHSEFIHVIEKSGGKFEVISQTYHRINGGKIG